MRAQDRALVCEGGVWVSIPHGNSLEMGTMCSG